MREFCTHRQKTYFIYACILKAAAQRSYWNAGAFE
jgi:hypothetical protein